jgi:hypothetical protein
MTKLAGEDSDEGWAARPILVRLEQLPSTAENIVRIRERIAQINQRFEDCGVPLRLRLV